MKQTNSVIKLTRTLVNTCNVDRQASPGPQHLNGIHIKLGPERKSCIVSYTLQLHSGSVPQHGDKYNMLQKCESQPQHHNSDISISFHFTFSSDLLHSRLSLGNARERCISGRIKGCRQTATKDPRLHAVISYRTVAVYVSIRGKCMSHFATMLSVC